MSAAGLSRRDPPAATDLGAALGRALQVLAPRAATPAEHPPLADLARLLAEHAPLPAVVTRIRELDRAGHLAGALVVLAEAAAGQARVRPELAVHLSRELLDAVAPAEGLALLRALLPTLEEGPPPPTARTEAHLLLGQALLDAGDPTAAARHFEAVLAWDLKHPRALRGWSRSQELGGAREPAPPLALAGLEDAEVRGLDPAGRYQILRPLGRGRHAMVFQAHDRHVGRDVALKRLLPRDAGDRLPRRAVEARFFQEARALMGVRSPHVVSLLDVRTDARFIVMDLCRGGSLLRALRAGRLGPDDLPRVAEQLATALRAVHGAGAVHRDVKPANILLRTAAPDSPLALADFGLALTGDEARAHAGTLPYLAPELRRPGARATPASDLFAAGVVLLELALAPAPRPAPLDTPRGPSDPRELVPEDLPTPWRERLRSLLSPRPEDRQL